MISLFSILVSMLLVILVVYILVALTIRSFRGPS